MRNTHRNSTATLVTLPKILSSPSSSLRSFNPPLTSSASRSRRSRRKSRNVLNTPLPPNALPTSVGKTAAKSTNATGDRRYLKLNSSLHARRQNSKRKMASTVPSPLATVAGSMNPALDATASGTQSGSNVAIAMGSETKNPPLPPSNKDSLTEMPSTNAVVAMVQMPAASTRASRSLTFSRGSRACHSTFSNARWVRAASRSPASNS
mmetsp:Transcript_10563/g.48579  ORF Transcript_10563/g.48579 Transcript_10563/m.48579 type:complete len:208 (-) Transcript_10563:232-855(-)